EFGHCPPKEERMSEAAVICETSRRRLHSFRPATGNRGETADCCARPLGLASPRSSTALESGSVPELRIVGVSDDTADHGIHSYLLLIGDDSALLPEQLRRAFPAPTHRVQVASTGKVGLEHVRTCTPDVIVLDVGLPNESGLEVYQQIRGINARIPVIF